MENQISASDLQNGTNIKITVESTIKTLVYDEWAKTKTATNKSFADFIDNLKNSGYETDSDIATKSGVDVDTFTKQINKFVNGVEDGSEISVEIINDSEPKSEPSAPIISSDPEPISEPTTPIAFAFLKLHTTGAS